MQALRDRQELAELLAPFGENEAALQQRLAAAFEKSGFHVHREVKSECRRCRIDLVVERGDFLAGVEVKLPARKRGRDLGAWLRQALRYTEARFRPWGQVPVYVFPQWSGLYLDEGEAMASHPVLEAGATGAQHNVSTLLGAFSIGELQLYRRPDYCRRRAFRLHGHAGPSVGWRFAMNGRVTWHTDEGLWDNDPRTEAV